MAPLLPPETFYLSAAQGWLMLGDAHSAEAELAQLAPTCQDHPEVLDFRWQLQAAHQDWPACLQLADQLIKADPDLQTGWIHRSYALHELKRTQEAWENLRPTVERFPSEPIIPYNLACYACQLGRHDEAWRWLEAAAHRSSAERILHMALGDADLKPIWPQLSSRGLKSPPAGA